MDHQQQQQQQQNRRRAVEAGGGGQNHPLPQPCPRCHSNNTKFCYYNNYSLSQPRFFCKGCRRYWTQGGTLRNVPVGGGCRKSKRPKLASDGSGSGSCSNNQSQLPPPPPLMSPPPPHQLPNHQLILNAQDHQLSMLSTTNAASAVATTGTDTISNNTPMMMAHHNFFGGGNNNNQGFLSSLAALQGGVNVNQPLSFGSNLGLLHGFGLPNFDHQPAQPNQQQQHTQNEPLHIPYTTREIGSSSSSMPPEWTLRMQPGPAAAETETNNATENHNHNHNRIRNRNINDGDDSLSDQQWPNFLGTSGLDDP